MAFEQKGGQLFTKRCQAEKNTNEIKATETSTSTIQRSNRAQRSATDNIVGPSTTKSTHAFTRPMPTTSFLSSAVSTHAPIFPAASISSTTSLSTYGSSSTTSAWNECSTTTSRTITSVTSNGASEEKGQINLFSYRTTAVFRPSNHFTTPSQEEEVFNHNEGLNEAAAVSASIFKISPKYLDESIVNLLIQQCQRSSSYELLFYNLSQVYSNVNYLSKSFRLCDTKQLPKNSSYSTNIYKMRDRNIYSTLEPMNTMSSPAVFYTPRNEINDIDVDLDSLHHVQRKLIDLNNDCLLEVISDAILKLTDRICGDNLNTWEQILYCMVICFDFIMLYSKKVNNLEKLLAHLCHAACTLSINAQARLAHIWAAHYRSQLLLLVQNLQQIITLHVIGSEGVTKIQRHPNIIAITKVMKILFYANILASDADAPTSYTAIEEPCSSKRKTQNKLLHILNSFDFEEKQSSKNATPFVEHSLEKELKVSSINCRNPLVPYEDFYNEALSDIIQMDEDYLNYRYSKLEQSTESRSSRFSYMFYSFILTPAAKTTALYLDNRMSMCQQMYCTKLEDYFNTDRNNDQSRFKLRIRRDHLVNDAFLLIRKVATQSPRDLKKRLIVEFVNEEGVDEGGLSKEFFQLLVEEIFNPDYGLFIQQTETNNVWFNSSLMENEDQFALVGILLGLAIYNNIILPVNFPKVVYRKLLGAQGTFYDVADWSPALYCGLKAMLDYDQPDVDDIFIQSFKITHKNVYGDLVEYDLKPGASDLNVGQHNKQEFVDLYSDFLLNKNIEPQFEAFKHGFNIMMNESPLKMLFRPEEIELLICGSKHIFDFTELEISAKCDGGYTVESQIIKDFWSILHDMPTESKGKFLEFVTGSSRVPIGGFKNLKLRIIRLGGDSDRLPMSHTCFNSLLLPEYSSKEKLEERLYKAINYSKGFGLT